MQSSDKTKYLNLLRLYNVLLFGALGMLLTFTSLHFKAIGFSGKQISTLMVVSSLVLFVFAPRFGMLMDASHDKRGLLLLASLVVALSMASVPLLRAFAPVLLLWTVYRSVNSPLFSALENLSYRVARDSGKGKSGFGGIRLWGSLGYAIFALLGGWIYQKFGILTNNEIFLVLMLAAMAVLLLIPKRFFQPEKDPSVHEAPLKLTEVLSIIVKDGYLLLMVLALALTDTLQDGIRSFESIYMQQLGLPEVMIGLASTLSALGEVPFMLWADRLIARLGIQKLISFIFVFDIFRRLLVWFFPTAQTLFFTAVILCISFTLRLVCTVSLVNQRLPARCTATANAFIGVTLYGLGHILSNAFSGLIFDRFGAHPLYLIGAGLNLISLALALVAGFFFSPRKTQCA